MRLILHTVDALTTAVVDVDNPLLAVVQCQALGFVVTDSRFRKGTTLDRRFTEAIFSNRLCILVLTL